MKISKIASFTKYTMALFSAFIMAFTSGCASGGFKLTREYARFVNSKTLILRILLYIFTSVVFAITLLIDSVIFNTIDFWEGRVSEGKYKFQNENKTFYVNHAVNKETGLKKSTIEIKDQNQKLIQVVSLNQLQSSEIEVYVDGVLRSKVQNLNSIPEATLYGLNNEVLDSKLFFGLDQNLSKVMAKAN